VYVVAKMDHFESAYECLVCVLEEEELEHMIEHMVEWYEETAGYSR